MYKPRTIGQQRLYSALRDPKYRLLIIRGPAGCGKTMFALQEALRTLDTGDTPKIFLIRPAVSCEESLGYLPGSQDEKLAPYMLPFYDSVGDLYPQSKWNQWRNDGRVEAFSIGFVRGRSFKHCTVIADEMQNATPHQLRTLLTRVGEGCRMIILGDPAQTDLQRKENGLADLWERLLDYGSSSGVYGAGFPSDVHCVELGHEDIQRDPLVAFAEDLYRYNKLGSPQMNARVAVHESLDLD
jgi:phosphate starvation-inducible PhoH-like protein